MGASFQYRFVTGWHHTNMRTEQKYRIDIKRCTKLYLGVSLPVAARVYDYDTA